MAKHKVTIRENTGATKDKAPFIGRYVTNGSEKAEKIFAAIAEHAEISPIAVQAIWEGVIAAITKCNQTEGATVFHFPGGLMTRVEITNTLTSSDAALTASNKIVQVLRLGSTVKNTLADVTPIIVSSDDLVKVRFDRVFDCDVMKPQSVLYGVHPFRCQGKFLSMTDQGARVYMLDDKGITYPCTVLKTPSTQEFTAKPNEVYEGGDYRLVIETRGGNADGNIQTVSKPIKYIKVIDPVQHWMDGHGFYLDYPQMTDGSSELKLTRTGPVSDWESVISDGWYTDKGVHQAKFKFGEDDDDIVIFEFEGGSAANKVKYEYVSGNIPAAGTYENIPVVCVGDEYDWNATIDKLIIE